MIFLDYQVYLLLFVLYISSGMFSGEEGLISINSNLLFPVSWLLNLPPLSWFGYASEESVGNEEQVVLYPVVWGILCKWALQV